MNYFWFLLLTVSLCSCQNGTSYSDTTQQSKKSYRIISYNVENLFDTIDDPSKLDDDFTPYGDNFWGKMRYEKKVNDIGKVLVNCSDTKAPALIGLVEVENKSVLEDLIHNSPLSKFSYEIVHEDSPDERGIDVALLYDTTQFQYLDYQIGRIQFPNHLADRTRDILLVKGILNKDTLFVAVNHWPSRRGGLTSSEPKREYVASQLLQKVESIVEKQPNSGILILGDFNDTPKNKSIAEVLGAKDWESNSELIDLMIPLEDKGLGTYKYQNQWNMLDHFIISRNLTDQNGSLLIAKNSVQIINQDWLNEDDPMYPGKRIYRTYRGPNYVGGFSDHYPIVMDIFTQ